MMLALPLAILSLPLLVQQVAAHGAVIRPWSRQPGNKGKEVCGQDWYDDRMGVANANNKFVQISPKDLAGNELPADCNWRLCGGAQFEDNSDHVYTWEAGTEVPIEVFALNRHGGVANVSVVDTATNTVIGSALKEWTDGTYLEYDFSNTCPDYPPLDQVNFNVTIPTLGDRCTQPGVCVLQWYWHSEKANDQTFESCIDFVQPWMGTPAAAEVTDVPSTSSWYRYCSPYTTTINYWNATSATPLAINTNYLNFATDAITAASVAVTFSASLLASSMAAAVTGSASPASATSGASSDSLIAAGTGEDGMGSSVAQATASSSSFSFVEASAVVSSATSVPGSSATPSTTSSSSDAVVSGVISPAAAAVAATSSTAKAVLSVTSTPKFKTACRARTSKSAASLAAAATADAVALSTTLTAETIAAAATSTTGTVIEAATTAEVAQNAAMTGETSAAQAASTACVGASLTVTVTETATQTVYVEVVAVGTSTAVSQTLAPVPTSVAGGMKRRASSIGHGTFKRRAH